MRRSDERGIALLLTLLVLTLLVALILEFDAEARREYRDAAAFRDNFKATVLARAAVQAARGTLQQDLAKDRKAGQFFDVLYRLVGPSHQGLCHRRRPADCARSKMNEAS